MTIVWRWDKGHIEHSLTSYFRIRSTFNCHILICLKVKLSMVDFLIIEDIKGMKEI